MSWSPNSPLRPIAGEEFDFRVERDERRKRADDDGAREPGAPQPYGPRHARKDRERDDRRHEEPADEVREPVPEDELNEHDHAKKRDDRRASPRQADDDATDRERGR
jgi:hypothetical protein